MTIKTKKIIAREGLIFTIYLIVIYIIIFKGHRVGFRDYTLSNLDSYIWSFGVWVAIYVAIRFIIWAIKTLRKK